jgi:hypothetical protein
VRWSWTAALSCGIFVDAVDTWRLCDLAASLVEVTRIAVQRLDHCDTCVDQDTVAVELGENDD